MLKLAAKVFFVALLVSSHKTVPFAYFFRFYYHVFRSWIFTRLAFLSNARKNTNDLPDGLFTWITLSTRVSPLEIDMYIHKSNSTYFLDLDIARTKLVLRIFQATWWNHYDNISKEYKSTGLANIPYAPIGTVKCTFKKELKVFEQFDIKSRVFAWDSKWLFIISKFVTVRKGQEKVHAIAMTKYVFKKNGRITIKPEEMIAEGGFLTEEVKKQNEINYQLVTHLVSTDQLEELI
ncbi:uncharacterized protein RJT21DRAFT_55239 [Scheffersomyces amazonensis]|uniref:uncharacterized protein n=1 Tax=Scheffersomyces amazonensis TaxID=1078765 RepID=UPI00315C4DC9